MCSPERGLRAGPPPRHTWEGGLRAGLSPSSHLSGVPSWPAPSSHTWGWSPCWPVPLVTPGRVPCWPAPSEHLGGVPSWPTPSSHFWMGLSSLGTVLQSWAESYTEPSVSWQWQRGYLCGATWPAGGDCPPRPHPLLQPPSHRAVSLREKPNPVWASLCPLLCLYPAVSSCISVHLMSSRSPLLTQTQRGHCTAAR